jgi:hypothetical protein
MRKRALLTVIAALMFCALASASAGPTELDCGFRLLYNLDFEAAQQRFASYQQQHPDDPMGHIGEAAGLLFAELDRLGALQTRLFADNRAFDKRPKLKADSDVYKQFAEEVARGEAMARRRLATHPQDVPSLLALTLAAGLRADYAALIQERNLPALRLTRDGERAAQALLAACPDCYDAYVATGISKYLVGELAAPLRWVLRLGGYKGDKAEGVRQLELAAERGRYLAPFARILLAVAYLREKRPDKARVLLSGLRDEFPRNPLFARELARLENK